MEKTIIKGSLSFSKTATIFVTWVVLFCSLYLSSLYNYLLFHSLVELFSVTVAAGIFMITWNSRQFQENGYLLFIGIAYFFIGLTDLLHTLSYKGMDIFYGYGANLPTQLWIAARSIESISLMVAPAMLNRKINEKGVFGVYSIFFIILMTTIFVWKIFPACFVEPAGLTPFKKISEYIISSILTISALLLYRNRDAFSHTVYTLIFTSILFTILSELAFTFYVSVYGLSNLAGHFMKLLSFYLIYKSIIETGLKRPYEAIFKNLKAREASLKRAKEELNSILNAVPNIIYRLDPQGKITFVSDSIRRYGYLPEDLYGQFIMELIHPDDRATSIHRINERRTGERKTALFEIRMKVKDKESDVYKDFFVTAEGLYSGPKPAGDGFLGAQGVAIDVTDKKQAEEERLFREKLQGVLEMAGAACHELNQPLQGIMSYSQLLALECPAKERPRELIGKIMDQVDKMAKITGRMMRITRYETKKYADSKIIDIDKSSP